MSGGTGRNTYIHGTEPSEQQRLVALNRLTNAAFVRFLSVSAGARVLEVGCGLGILASEVALAADDVHVTGVERSTDQIASAVRASNVTYVLGDAHTLDFSDGTFDLAYARYLLEHVTDPSKVLREMRRVTRAGGRVAVCENDITLVRLDPPCQAFEKVWKAFCRFQQHLGGDPLIGRRLHRLFRSAGFSHIELSVQPEVHWQGSSGFVGWVQNLIGNIESARGGLIELRLCEQADYDNAVAEMKALCDDPDGSAQFTWNRAMAER